MTNPQSGDDLEQAVKYLWRSRQECGPTTQDTQRDQEDQPANRVITLRDGSKVPTSYPVKEKPAKPPRGSKVTKKVKPSTSIEKHKGAERQLQAQIKTENSPYIDNNLGNDNCGEFINKQIDIDIKAKLTLQELKFLEIYLSERITIDNAIIQAGYGNYSKDWRYKLAKKIVIKYERSGGEAAKIFQELGFGQIKVVQGIIDKAENAKSEMVSLNALALAAKCCRMTEEKERTGQGISINIITTVAAPGGPGPGPIPSQVVIAGVTDEDQPPAPRRPLQITR
jgi:hypothetical protein